MTAPVLASSPHTHSMFTVSRTMVAVMVCLAPATGLGLWHFGWPAAFLFAVTVLSALFWEVLCLWIAGKPVARFAADGSAVLTGWLLAMTLPPWAPWWVGFVGAGIALVIGKHIYGGLGQNLFNPAMVARAMLLIALPVQLTQWVPAVDGVGPSFHDALGVTFGAGADFDAVSSASVLGHMKAQLSAGMTVPDIMAELPGLRDQFLGRAPGSLGETGTAFLLAGGLCLMLLRIITPTIPLAVLGALGLFSGVAWLVDPARFPSPLVHLSAGGAMLCAFFIATDYVTSPVTGLGKLVYGIGVGGLIFLIRSFGSFPEGVAFAVLLMNACTPLIEAWTRPRIFGRKRSGEPLDLRRVK